MSYPVDADWISSFLNGRTEAIQLIAELADEGIVLSVIAYGEIHEGLLRDRSPQRLSQFEQFSATMDIIRLTSKLPINTPRYAWRCGHGVF